MSKEPYDGTHYTLNPDRDGGWPTPRQTPDEVLRNGADHWYDYNVAQMRRDRAPRWFVVAAWAAILVAGLWGAWSAWHIVTEAMNAVPNGSPW
jgi:hypothetical protein